MRVRPSSIPLMSSNASKDNVQNCSEVENKRDAAVHQQSDEVLGVLTCCFGYFWLCLNKINTPNVSVSGEKGKEAGQTNQKEDKSRKEGRVANWR